MSNNPFFNALGALAYIGVLTAFFMNVQHFFGEEDPILLPAMFMAIIVLSVLVMGYTLLLAPIRLYLDGEKARAVSLLTKTILWFAGITVAIIGITIAVA